MIVEFFPAAEADLIRQFRYYLVNCDAPEVAARFRESVRTSVGMLRLNPRIGVGFFGSIEGLRSWPVAGFKKIQIYYIGDETRIRVVRILHGRQNVRRILSRERHRF